MGSIEKDLGTRLHHWANSLDMMDPDLPTRLLGMGLGQYPITYAFRNPDGLILASYRFSGTREDPYLELGAGDTMYYEQIVDLRPNATYTLSVDIKSTVDEGSFSASICEKAMLYSFKCEWITLRYEEGTGGWQKIEYRFNSGEVGGGDIFDDRPVKISLFNSTRNSIISLDNIKLVDARGMNLIRNGDFSKTNDRWFFSTDNHLPWHTKQLGVQIYFSQGLLGLSVFLLFLTLTLTGLLKAGFEGDAFSIALVSSIVAFASIGLFSSPFDAPRLTLVFFSLLFLANHYSEKRSLRASYEIH